MYKICVLNFIILAHLVFEQNASGQNASEQNDSGQNASGQNASGQNASEQNASDFEMILCTGFPTWLNYQHLMNPLESIPRRPREVVNKLGETQNTNLVILCVFQFLNIVLR